MNETILNKISNIERLIKTCPELFHDGINEDILSMLHDLKKLIMLSE